MKLNSKLLVLIASLALFSCTNDNNSDNSNDSNTPGASCTSDIPFFQTGKFLVYDMTQFGFAAGSMRMDFGACDGNGIYALNRKFFNTAGTQTSATTDKIKISGNFLAIDVQNSEDFYERLYKKNPQLGDVWEDTKTDGTIYRHEVFDMDSIVTVPAGTFHCVVYKATRSTTINDSYLFWNSQFGEIMEDSGFVTLKLRSHN